MVTDKNKAVVNDEDRTVRAARKRAGLPVNPNAHDHTQDGDSPSDDASVSTGVMAAEEKPDYKPAWQGGSQTTNAQPAAAQATQQTTQQANDDEYSQYLERQKAATDAYVKNLGDISDLIKKQMSARDDMETDEEKKRRERREKNAMFLSGIGDAANAFHQAYAYGRGVKPMNDDKSLSEKTRERIKKAKEERYKNNDAILNYYKVLADLEAKKASAEQNVFKDKVDTEYKIGSLEWRRDQLQRLRDRDFLDERKQDWKEKYEQGRLDIAAEKNEIDRAYKEGLLSLRGKEAAIKELNAQTGAIKAQGYTEEKTDSHGKKTVVTRTPNGAAGNAGSNNGGNTGGLGWGKTDW